MDRMLITGGAGTIGSAFIEKYRGTYRFFALSRNESSQTELKRRFPEVTCLLGDIANEAQLQLHYETAQPRFVIHAAALKHINLAETQPLEACRLNVLGSLNVVRASIRNEVRYTVGVSTDKACEPDSVYGYTKLLMERCFLEADAPLHRFTICRLVNVAHSNGSVLPFWLAAHARGEPLKVTDPDMRRLMMTQAEAAQLLQETAVRMERGDGGFILAPLAKCVRIGDLAAAISPVTVGVGRRPGEKLDEMLISTAELNDAVPLIGDVARIGKSWSGPARLPCAYGSATAPLMSPEEIQALIHGKAA